MLRERIDLTIRQVIADVLSRKQECDVLEIGAGHGSFTDTVLAAGGTPTATEMSKASFAYLSKKFAAVPSVRIVYDADGEAYLADGRRYDVVLLISVIHHVPDYLELLRSLAESVVRPGGAIVTFQDPVWYPRQARWQRAVSDASYLAWRVFQGEFRRGLRTRMRRLRGVYDQSEPSDLVEYHVVRQGCDDVAMADVFRAHFRDVSTEYYFSTQLPLLQAIGTNRFPPNTFGIVARGRDDSR
mgnify:FL=1